MEAFSITTKNDTKRIEYWDFLKGLAMLLVVFQHCIGATPIGKCLLAFHMPLFFVITGWLNSTASNKNIDWKLWLKKKAYRLLLPYFAFELFNLAMACILSVFTRESVPVLKELVNIVLCLNNARYRGFLMRLWFLPCMFWASAFTYVINKFARSVRMKWVATGISLLIAYISVKSLPIRLPFALDIAIVATPFVLLGEITGQKAKSYFEKRSSTPERLIQIAVFVLCLVGLLFCSQYNSNIYMYNNSYGIFGVFFVGAICGCVAFGLISKIFMTSVKFIRKWIIWFGVNSLACFPTHIEIKFVLSSAISALGLGFVSSVVLFVLIVLINVPVVNIINKYFPYMIGNVRKKKGINE